MRQGFNPSNLPVDTIKARALSAAQTAVKLDPQDARAHMYLANATMLNRNKNLTRRHIDISLSLNPYNTQILINSAWKFSLLGDWERGKEYALQAIRLHPSPPPEFETPLAMYDYMTGNASGFLTHALNYYQPSLFTSNIFLIMAHQNAGNTEKAAEAVRLTTENFPNHVRDINTIIKAWNINPQFEQKLRKDLTDAGLHIPAP